MRNARDPKGCSSAFVSGRFFVFKMGLCSFVAFYFVELENFDILQVEDRYVVDKQRRLGRSSPPVIKTYWPDVDGFPSRPSAGVDGGKVYNRLFLIP